MGKGLWTSGGHFVLAYKLKNGYVYINDPASTQSNRLKNKLSTWQNDVKYYWVIEVDKKDDNTATVNTNGGNLICRKIANKEGAIVGYFKSGTKLKVISKKYKKWWKVSGKNTKGDTIEGFCNVEFLS